MSKIADHAYWKLREMISTGGLASGERLREDELAEICNASRTPVREALRRMEAEALIVRRNGAAFIREWTLQDLRETSEVRALLESFATENAALRLTGSDLDAIEYANLKLRALAKGANIDTVKFRKLNIDFHEQIWVIGLPSQVALLKRVAEESFLYRRMQSISPQVASKICDEHDQVIDALRRRDGRLARDCMSTHVRMGVQVFLAGIDESKATTAKAPSDVTSGSDETSLRLA